MRIIICDTGPVLHLREVKALHLLAVAGDVLIPTAVDTELHDKIPSWPKERPNWLRVERLTPDEGITAARWLRSGELDAGEAEAIAMAQSRRPDWLITDDAAARLFASLMGLEVHGSLGIVLWAAASGHLTHAEAHAILNRLARSSFWISEQILSLARKTLDDLAL